MTSKFILFTSLMHYSGLIQGSLLVHVVPKEKKWFVFVILNQIILAHPLKQLKE